MRQGVRFFVKPNTFVNQLQWSSHHTWLLLAFLIVAGVEAHVGRNHAVIAQFADSVAFRLGVSRDIGLWLMISVKLSCTLLAAYLISLLVWFVGSFLGSSSSQRVLFRRLSVVFTLVFAGYTSTHLTHIFPWMETASLFLFFWAALLGFFSLKEQFRLGLLETAFVGSFTALLVFSSWHYSNRFIEKNAQLISHEIAYRPLISESKALKGSSKTHQTR